MNILIIGNYELDEQHSMQRYGEELYKELLNRKFNVKLLKPKNILGKFSFKSIFIQKWLGYIDKYILFSFYCKFTYKKYDIIHIIDQANSPYRSIFRCVPVVITCHDLFAVRGALGLMKNHRPRLTGRILQQKILHSLKKSSTIICVSHSTAESVQNILGIKSVKVIPNSIRDSLRPLNPELNNNNELFNVKSKFFLHVGGNQFYKNRVGVVGVFNEIANYTKYKDHNLILAGKYPDDILKRAIFESPHKEKILIMENPSDLTIQQLYSRAEALLFLSIDEGFGWPIIEAQACGCVVATNNKEPMRSIGGSAAIFVDIENYEDAATKIVNGLESNIERRIHGLCNANNYRIGKIIDSYIFLYRDVIKNSVIP